MSVKITWLGHASVLITDGSSTVYIDPWKTGSGMPKADCVLLTHDHYDHYSEPDLKKVSQSSTRVVSPVSLPQVTDRIKAGGKITVGSLTIEAVPAYNTDKNFHPRSNGWVGYVVVIGGKRIYHAGDTDRIPEMKGLNVDLALVPVGGTYTMTRSRLRKLSQT
jgi:L-ascorbate metabolism protein UlaG (beta-lactamase superfamily)